ncbi:hypothetical protein KVR01_006720 [Diaporthe batatas]|uniref:uncharacterized protein n=1 Tax=Diaporthe batatas TaxID=748121 RepID=UPI001D05A00F|nr:uncharacterized protein KVR01_006720 [Diaporthe batatas]KAG8163423.1 hypothetical protein KVR01_006720 [Diaporthe batatas]
MNNKRKRTVQVPIPNAPTKTETPNSDGQGHSRPDKRLKRAELPLDKTSRELKTRVVTSQRLCSKIGQRINRIPLDPLDIFVFGEGSSGELGLGSKIVKGQSLTDVTRPRLNKLLSADDIGVIQITCGGMHAVALTKDNKILTWGVNDLGALGRATNVEEDEDDVFNPAESTPGPVDVSGLDPNIRWAQVAASDNASFALTDDGRVYGWGTFRSTEGIMGFSRDVKVQKTPVLIPDLQDIRQLAAGNNHVLAVDGKGKVYAWGCGEQGRLGRKVLASHPELGLRPASVGALPIRGAKATQVACGSYHSFAVDEQGRVYAWGLNTYAQLGTPDGAGEDNAHHFKPRLVEALKDYKVTSIAGGEHHSLASSDDGKLLTWGRIDGNQVGVRPEAITAENTVYDERGTPRILKTPTVIPDIPPISLVAAGTDHSFALTTDGKAYSWGFSSNGRTGQGTEDDIKIPTVIDGQAVNGKMLVVASAGGSFSILAMAHNS